MHFSGSVNCPQFMANRFRKNICTGCQQKIDAHSGASELQISEALEYAVDKSKMKVYTSFITTLSLQNTSNVNHFSVPSVITKLENGSSLYVGGYKASINIDFLQTHNIGLIIHACPGLEQQFGSKVASLFKKRRQSLPQVKEGNGSRFP